MPIEQVYREKKFFAFEAELLGEVKHRDAACS